MKPTPGIAEMQVRVRVSCPACGGTGRWAEHDGGSEQCPHCHGAGHEVEWVSLAGLVQRLVQAADWWRPAAPAGDAALWGLATRVAALRARRMPGRASSYRAEDVAPLVEEARRLLMTEEARHA